MPDAPRRRRLGEGPSRGGGGLPLVPLIIVVVLGGLLLGAVLAHYFGSKNQAIVQATPSPMVTPLPTQNPLPAQTPLEATPSPVPAPTRTPKSTPTPGATPSPAVTASAASPKVSTSPKPLTSKAVTSPKPVGLPKSAATPKPQAVKTPARTAATPPVVHSAPPPTATDQAENVVRYYLDALARGDTGEARSYLSGSDPTEASFMTHSAHLTSLHTSAAGGNAYDVNADVSTSQGEYFITFTVDVEPGGAIITDHTAIKP